MKNILKYLTLFLAIPFLFVGCNSKKDVNTNLANQKGENKLISDKLYDSNILYDNIENEMNNLFTLDYTPLEPEVNSKSNKINTKKINQKTDSSEQSESFINKIRNLADYKTKYYTEKQKLPIVTNANSEDETIQDDKDFTVVTWGPTSFDEDNIENPSFYVIFSKPVIELSSLQSKSKANNILEINPPLKGKERWIRTNHVCFEAEENLDFSTEYTITVNKNLKSIDKKTLKGESVFTVKTPPLSITTFMPGYIGQNDRYYGYDEICPPYEKKVFMRVNYAISKEQIIKELSIKCSTKKQLMKFEAVPLYDKSDFSWNGKLICNQSKEITNTFVINITDEVPINSKIYFRTSNDDKNFSYNTLKKFSLNGDKEPYIVYDQSSSHLEARFTQEIDSKTIIDNIETSLDYKITEENIKINYKTLCLYNLPLTYNSSFTFKLKNGLKDIYGQNFNTGDKSFLEYNIKIGNAKSYITYLDNGFKMMEAQYPHKLIYCYQNINEDSYYSVQKTNNPLFIDYQNSLSENKKLPVGELNKKQFYEIDLDSYLDDGFGFAEIYTNCFLPNKDNSLYSDKNYLTVQVTDLGITCRIGINKAVVMVRSLSSGKPIENAEVFVLPLTYSSDLDEETSLAKGITDKNGIAIINIDNENHNFFLSENLNDRDNPIALLVKNGKDKAIFTPNSHTEWRYVDYKSSITKAMKSVQQTFFFVDRMLYKPGETVTFKGIDRNQILGQLQINKGEYLINLQNINSSDENAISTINGELSDSGGFYGSFTLPQDIKNGTYALMYTRKSDDNEEEIKWYNTDRVYIKVASFEELKTQSQIDIPEKTYFAGDEIKAQLNASYLAGGYLSGANYETNWYKQEIKYQPTNLQNENYTFGFSSLSYGRNQYSSTNGTLSNQGTADSICITDKNVYGKTFEYRVEVEVTDISNQTIAATNSVIVHPALFYIGLKQNIVGFSQKNKEIQIPYIIVNPEGELIGSKKDIKSLKYELSHTEWSLVQEKAVDNSVYTRYKENKIIDDSGDIQIANKGTFKFIPKNSGWNKITFFGEDKNNNKVTTEYEFYVSGGDFIRPDSNNAESINLTPSASLYNPGDTAQILLESPLPRGDYLVTTEREGIFTEEIYHFDSPSNIINIKIARNYIPVVYVTVSSYSSRTKEPTQKFGETDINKPKGYFGATTLFINPDVMSFSVTMKLDKDKYKPGEKATLTLKATKGGKPVENAELTVFAADRSVLDLVNYHVPNPIDFFYNPSHYPLYTTGGDSRDYLMNPVIYSIKDLQGGDAEAEKDEDESERKDFRATAFFEPSLITGQDGTVKYSFNFPDNLTTYRITAFGVKNDLFALNESEALVQNPINIQKVQPRMLRERDTAECGVLITNLTDKSQKVSVTVETRQITDDISSDKTKGLKTKIGNAFIDGESQHTVTVQSNDSSVVYFDVAAQAEGTVELVYIIKSDDFNEKLVSKINIEKTFVYETATATGSILDEETSASEKIAIPSNIKDNRGELKITLDATRLGPLGTSVNYLFDYPYGCLEQQSSKVLPLLLFSDYIDVFGMDSKITDAKSCIKSTVKDWYKSQKTEGGFPYWPNGDDQSLFVTLRMAHIYALSLEKGFSENDFNFDSQKMQSFIVNSIKKDNSNSNKTILAYACFVISLYKNTDMDLVLSALYEQMNNLDVSSLSYVAMAYMNYSGDENKVKADTICKEISKRIQINGRGASIIGSKKQSFFYFDTESSELALSLKALVMSDKNNILVDKLLFSLLQKQSLGYWKNTVTTSCVLDAIGTLIEKRELSQTDYLATVKLNNNEIMSKQMKGLNPKADTLCLDFTDNLISTLPLNTNIPLNITKDGNGNLYYTAELKYAIPDESQYAYANGLEIEYNITDADSGNDIKAKNNTMELESGKIYKGTISVKSKNKRFYVALRAPIPSGAEILDSSFATTSSKANSVFYSYDISNKEIKNNEIRFFYDEFDSGSEKIEFIFKATRRGVYPTPPVQGECMYESETWGRSEGFLYIIK